MITEQDIVNIFNDWKNNSFCVAELRRKYTYQIHAILFCSDKLTIKEISQRLPKIKYGMHPQEIRKVME